MLQDQIQEIHVHFHKLSTIINLLVHVFMSNFFHFTIPVYIFIKMYKLYTALFTKRLGEFLGHVFIRSEKVY